jgi:flagellin
MSVINTNTVAEQTSNNLRTSHNALAKSLARLSSGSRIVNPSDDAAGLAVSSRLESQIKRLDAALNNVVNAVSFTQTQDGFLKTVDRALRRMSELAMLAQDGTKSEADLKLYNEEFDQLKQYIGQTADKDFNGVLLFGGAISGISNFDPVEGEFTTSGAHKLATGTGVRFSTTNALPQGIEPFTKYFIVATGENTFKLSTSQAGSMGGNPPGSNPSDFVNMPPEIDDPANPGTGIPNVGSGNHTVIVAESEQAVTIDASGSTFKMPGIDLTSNAFREALAAGSNIESTEGAVTALQAVNDAIGKIALDRAKLGAVQSRLNFTNDQLTTTKENLSSAISRIADVDVAQEATEYARYQILVQSGTAMLAQANALPRSVLELLR